MYIISTAILVSIVALASSLAVVVQAWPKNHTKPHYGCFEEHKATETTCGLWRMELNPVDTEQELCNRVKMYNTGVNQECNNLILGDIYCVYAHGCGGDTDAACQRGVNGDL